MRDSASEASSFAQALEFRMAYSDLGEVTIREYFRKLLLTLLKEAENFDSKDWYTDIVYSLIQSEMIEGELIFDEHGYIDRATYDEAMADKYVSDLIDYCFFGQAIA